MLMDSLLMKSGYKKGSYRRGSRAIAFDILLGSMGVGPKLFL